MHPAGPYDGAGPGAERGGLEYDITGPGGNNAARDTRHH